MYDFLEYIIIMLVCDFLVYNLGVFSLAYRARSVTNSIFSPSGENKIYPHVGFEYNKLICLSLAKYIFIFKLPMTLIRLTSSNLKA